VYNYFTHAFNDMLLHQSMNMTTHMFSYSLTDVETLH